MAWVTLHNLLEKDKNLYGSVPPIATVKLYPGLKEKNDGEASVMDVKALYKAKNWKNMRLEEMHDKVMTLEEFLETYSHFANDIEWSFGNGGKDASFYHFSDGVYDINGFNKVLKKKGAELLSVGDNPYSFIIFCELDLSDWLRQQPLEKVKEIAEYINFGFVHSNEDMKKLTKKRDDWITKYSCPLAS
jgi:hypothetical protein